MWTRIFFDTAIKQHETAASLVKNDSDRHKWQCNRSLRIYCPRSNTIPLHFPISSRVNCFHVDFHLRMVNNCGTITKQCIATQYMYITEHFITKSSLLIDLRRVISLYFSFYNKWKIMIDIALHFRNSYISIKFYININTYL